MLEHRKKKKTNCNSFIFLWCKTSEQRYFLFQLALTCNIDIFFTDKAWRFLSFFLLFSATADFSTFKLKPTQSLSGFLQQIRKDLKNLMSGHSTKSSCNCLCSFHIFIFLKQTTTWLLHLDLFHISFRKKKKVSRTN